MDPGTLAQLQAVIQAYRSTTYVNYLGIGGFALVVADFLHTFPDEVRLMWPTPLSLPKILFFALRYYMVAHHILAALYAHPLHLAPEECKARFIRVGISSILTITASEAVLFIRVYAFSGKNRKLLVYLILQFLAIHATAFYLLTRFLRTVEFVQLPFPSMFCMPSGAKSVILGGVWALLLGSVVIVMLMMMYIAFRKYKNFNNALLTIFYRDGVFYFISLSVLACANMIVNFAAADGGIKFLLVLPEIDIHVLLSTRMLLHLRKWAERDRVQGRGDLTGTMADAMKYSTTVRRDLAYGSRRAPSPMQFQKREVAAPGKSLGTVIGITTVSEGRDDKESLGERGGASVGTIARAI